MKETSYLALLSRLNPVVLLRWISGELKQSYHLKNKLLTTATGKDNALKSI